MPKSRRQSRRSLQPEGAAGRLPLATWKKACFAAVVCIVFFLVVELVLAMVGVEPVVDREDPFHGFSGLVSVFVKDGQHYRTRPTLANGVFNDQRFLAVKPANGLRLFCLGGSSAYGYPWGARAAFPSILGDVLARAHADRHVEAINAAGVSYAMHRVNIVGDEVIQYEPDILIGYSGHNEFIEPDFFAALKHRSAARNRLDFLVAHSRIYSALRSLRLPPPGPSESFEQRFAAAVARDRSRRYSPRDKAEVVAEFRWRLERLVRRATQRGIHVALATVPCNLSRWRPEASIVVAPLDAGQRKHWQELLTAGKRAFDEGKVRDALEQLRQAVRIAPSHAETHFLLGQAYEALQQWNRARVCYIRACDEDASPSRRVSAINDAIRQVAAQQRVLLVDCDALFTKEAEHELVGFNLIEDYVHPTRPAHEKIAWAFWQAIEAEGWIDAKNVANRPLFDQVLATRSPVDEAANATWLFNQGVILEKQGSFQQAMAKYRAALAQNPGHEGATHNLASLLADRGRYEEALALLDPLLRAVPDHRNGRVLEAEILLQQGRNDTARERFEALLRDFPESVRGHVGLARALAASGDARQARHHYGEAIRIDPENVEAHIGLGILAAGEGDFGAARSHLLDAVKLRPDDAAAYYNLGLLSDKQGALQDAARFYQRALETDAAHAEGHLALGSLRLREGNLEEARRHYAQALAARPGFAQAHYGLALVFSREGKLADALRHGELAAQSDPRDIRSRLLLARLLTAAPDRALRDPRKAIGYAQQAAALTGYRHAGALDALAAAHAAAGEWEKAITMQEKAIAAAPESAKAKLRERLNQYRVGKP